MLQGEFGKYRIEDVIGMGGMSIVYRALDQSTNREAALKILNVRRMSNPVEVRRFQREVEIAQRLRHPNIIDIYEYGEVENFAYLAMEYMPGGSLAERYANPIHLTLGESAEMLKVIASALDFAHSEGVLHRDLKLSNVLIAADGRLTLSDFGLALMQDESRITRTGQTFGTPIYMSPEQVNGVRGIDYRADVYSFAVIAYLLATGYFPFMSSNTLMILNQHLSDRAPLASKLNPRLPTELDDVLLKGLSKKPEDRQTSAGALYRAFTQAIAGCEDTEIVILTSQPTPIIEPSSHYGFKPPVPRVTEETDAVRDWQGEITPDLSAIERTPASAEAGALVTAAATRRSFSRWTIAGSLAATAFAVLLALGTLVPTPPAASRVGLENEGTRAPTATLQASQMMIEAGNDSATPTLPVFVGLSTAIAGSNGNSSVQINPVATGMVAFMVPSATATQMATVTQAASATPLTTATQIASATQMETTTVTPRPTEATLRPTLSGAQMRATFEAAEMATQTPTITPTYHEVYMMVTPSPTTRSANNNRAAVQATAAPQTQQQSQSQPSSQGQQQARPTSVPATSAPQPTSVPATAVPQSGLLGSPLNPLLAPVGSLLPVVPTLVSALP